MSRQNLQYSLNTDTKGRATSTQTPDGVEEQEQASGPVEAR
jgi:hypothetical protein